MTAASRGRVAVLGAGVIGLTCAVRLLDRGFEVRVYAAELPKETASFVAAASFKPYGVAVNDLTVRLTADSWAEFNRLGRDYDAKDTGIVLHDHWEASSAPLDARWYADIIGGYRYYERPFVPGAYAYGLTYKTYLIEMPRFLAWLERYYVSRTGVPITVRRFESFDEVAELDTDIVLNCTGYGAKQLCDDPDMSANKGQVAILSERATMGYSISADGFYCYPRSSDTVLGGTDQHDDESSGTIDAVTDLLLRANARVLPYLRNRQPAVTALSGIRPYRAGSIRLEREVRQGQTIVHAYGHGGAGVTLSLGTASAVVSLL